MAETKKNVNTKKNANSKKNTNNKKNTDLKKDNNKVKDIVKENKKVEEVIVEEKKKVKNEESFAKKHLADILLISAAVLVVIIGIVAVSKNSKNNSSDGDYLVELSFAQYTDMQNAGEKFPFIIESATCVHCQNFLPVAKKVANKNKVYVYYIDLDKLKQEDYTQFLSSNTFFDENESWGTPTTIVLTGKEVSDSLVGEATEDAFTEFLQKNELMG